MPNHLKSMVRPIWSNWLIIARMPGDRSNGSRCVKSYAARTLARSFVPREAIQYLSRM